MNDEYRERKEAGDAGEKRIRLDIESRGWNVEPGLRDAYSPGLNKFLTNWRDSHSRPFFGRWFPDLMVWRSAPALPSDLATDDPDQPSVCRVERSALVDYQNYARLPSHLYAVDVKVADCNIERRALLTYQDFAERFNIPVIVVFDFDNGEPLVSSAGKLVVNAIPQHGISEERTPFYKIAFNKLSPMERFFGPKRSE